MGNTSPRLQLPSTLEKFDADLQRASKLGENYEAIRPRFECTCKPCFHLSARWKQHTQCFLLRTVDGHESRTKISLKQFYEILAVLEAAQSSAVRVSELVQDLNDSDAAAECCLCMENTSNVSLACSHAFCEECLSEWLAREETCPLCREDSSAEDSYVMISEDELALQHADYVSVLIGMLNKIR
eukprot:TRINITY_DN17212_c0_g1_i1.p1 TRINITY_DN17212_c0_g1~~TRINITY_DN17212_c0_g1_i1.p1  ORF type:complete len:185 (+),score=41.69 TRINITY_DN17212_c0_g1_i1:176-730(+)